MITQDNLNIILAIPGIVFAATAVYLTWRVYKRENTLNNENYIYQKKYEVYENLFSLAVEYLTAAEDVRISLKMYKKNNPVIDKKEFNEKTEIFEKIEERLELAILKAAMLVSGKVLNGLSDFLFKAEPWNEPENIQAWDKNINFYYYQIEQIQILISKDLHLKELSDGIFNRLNKEQKGGRRIIHR